MSSASSVLCFRRRPCDLRGTIVDIGAGTCNCGALLGSQIGGGSGQIVGAAVGTLGGALVGGAIGKNMDDSDKRK